jgi:hypothetical protein
MWNLGTKGRRELDKEVSYFLKKIDTFPMFNRIKWPEATNTPLKGDNSICFHGGASNGIVISFTSSHERQ